VIWGASEAEYFCRGGWTTQITLIGFNNLALCEIADSAGVGADQQRVVRVFVGTGAKLATQRFG
jgi:hypothetical protein